MTVAQPQDAGKGSSSPGDSHEYRTSAIEMGILKAVDGAVDRLNRLGVAIRQSSTRNIMARGLTDNADFNSFKELAHVVLKTLYPAANDELHEQLSRSMAERYCEITDRQSRHDRLQKRRRKPSPCLRPIPENTEVEEQPKSVIIESPRETYCQLAERMTPPRRDNVPPSELSSINHQVFQQQMATSPNVLHKTASCIQINELDYPKAPQGVGSSNQITCPWCFETQEKSYFEGDNWRYALVLITSAKPF